MNTDEKDSEPTGKRIEIVPTEVCDFDFSDQANRSAPRDYSRKKVPLNPSPLPQGRPIPADEILNRDDGE
jgi:hypothetical protein